MRPKSVTERAQGVKRKRNYSGKKNKESVANSSGVALDRRFNGYLTRSKRSRLAKIEVNIHKFIRVNIGILYLSI